MTRFASILITTIDSYLGNLACCFAITRLQSLGRAGLELVISMLCHEFNPQPFWCKRANACHLRKRPDTTDIVLHMHSCRELSCRSLNNTLPKLASSTLVSTDATFLMCAISHNHTFALHSICDDGHIRGSGDKPLAY